jgi:hypothetical protein
MNAARLRLPNRHPHLVIEFEHGGFAYMAGVGFFDDAGQEPARHAAIAASLLLRHGWPIETLRHALMPNGDGSASGRLAPVLDLLDRQGAAR